MTIELVGVEERGPGKIVVPRRGDRVQFQSRGAKDRGFSPHDMLVLSVEADGDVFDLMGLLCNGWAYDYNIGCGLASIVSVNGIPVDNRATCKEASDATHS